MEKFPSEYGTVIDAVEQVLTYKLKYNARIKLENSDNPFLQSFKSVKEVSIKQLKTRSLQERIFGTENICKIHPDSQFRIGWDCVMLLVLLYMAIIIPLRIALRIDPWLFVLDYIGDVINLVDVYLYFTVFTVYQGGELLVSSADIRRNFLQQRGLVDVIAAFPYDILTLAFMPYYRGDALLLIRAALRVPKLLKFTIVRHYVKQLEYLAKILNFSYFAFRLFDLICSVLIICHFTACIFQAFAVYGQRRGACLDEPGAVYGKACEFRGTWVAYEIATLKLPPDGGSQWSQFIRAWNWAATTLTGETMGDVFVMNQNECLFAFIVIVFGVALNGMIIGSIMNLVTDASEEKTRKIRNMEQLGAFLRQEHVPEHLVLSATQLLRHQASDQGMVVVAQERILSELPLSVQEQINDHVKTLPFLRRCPFFDFCSDEVLRGISAKLRQQLYIRGDLIVVAGELGHEMFFLESGSVNVVSADQQTLFSTLEDGAFFGETALVFYSARTATIVVASPVCVCLVLTKGDLDQELRQADIDEEAVLDEFRALQETNRRRNAAVTANLNAAKEPDKKLYKLIRQEDTSSNSASLLTTVRLILSPNSIFRLVWDVLGLLFLVYYTFSIPFHFAFLFGSYTDSYVRYIAADFAVDVYWIIDIVCKLTLFSFKPDMFHDRVITDGEHIRNRYLASGNFHFDLAASIPLELLALVPGTHSMTLFAARFIHLLRVPQLRTYSNFALLHLRLRFNFTIQRTVALLLRIAFIYVVLNHWMACGYFCIHRYTEFNADWTFMIADGRATYLPEEGRHDICNTSLSYCYARCCYLVVTIMAGIGYGDISPHRNPEFVYQCMVSIVGAMIAATVLGFLGMYLEDLDASGESAFKKKLRSIHTYIQFRQLEAPEKDALLAQYQYNWRRLRSTRSNRNAIVDQLSPSMAMEISMHLHAEVLDRVRILAGAPAQMRRRLAYALTPQVRFIDMRVCVFFLPLIPLLHGLCERTSSGQQCVNLKIGYLHLYGESIVFDIFVSQLVFLQINILLAFCHHVRFLIESYYKTWCRWP